MYKIKFTRQALKDLKQIDKSKQKIIIKKIEDLSDGFKDNKQVKKLQGDNPYYRLRMGDYRIIFEKDGEQLIIIILKIGNRGDIYKRV